jgi:hypothetical protein
MKLLGAVYSMRVVFNERGEESKVSCWALTAGYIRGWNRVLCFKGNLTIGKESPSEIVILAL